MSDQQPEAPTEESFTFTIDKAVVANQRLVHHFRNDETAWYVIVEWITPDDLADGTPLYFALSLLPTGPRGIVKYKTVALEERTLIVHAERPVLQ